MQENHYQSVHKGETIDEVVTDYMRRKQSGISADTDVQLDEEAVRARSSEDSSYPVQTARVEVLDVEAFSRMTRLEANTLYIVTKTAEPFAESQTTLTPQNPTT